MSTASLPRQPLSSHPAAVDQHDASGDIVGSGDARNTVAPLKSSGSPHRPAGMRARIEVARADRCAKAVVLSVTMYPGAIAFTCTRMGPTHWPGP